MAFTVQNNVEHGELLILEISGSLLNLGFRTKLKGYIYSKEAIYYYTRLDVVRSINAEVYSQIAYKYGVSAASVERAIKKSIEDTWYNKQFNCNHELLRCASINSKYPPTNAEFIATMAELIRLKARKERLYNS
ncbi:MAG: hypothetical protein IJX77_07760 [Ruminococcus sp.]|nr:hypothetical protein [Ruminococcus sp.]